MARGTFELNFEQIIKLNEAILNYGVQAGREIDDVLHNEGAELITEEIMRLLPQSGRDWSGKKKAAKKAKPFRQDNDSLSVTIRTKKAYHYLYFPDDGTTTSRHVGFKGKPREFMRGGAERSSEDVVDLCINRLIKKWESE